MIVLIYSTYVLESHYVHPETKAYPVDLDCHQYIWSNFNGRLSAPASFLSLVIYFRPQYLAASGEVTAWRRKYPELVEGLPL